METNSNLDSLWIEKYRFKKFEDMAAEPALIEKLNSFIEKGEIPHLLFTSSTAGSGKTSVAKVLVNKIPCDSIYINASDENNTETVRNKIKDFASTSGWNDKKIIILDECLEASTLVTIKRAGKIFQVPIENVEETLDTVKSYNFTTKSYEWKAFKKIDNGIKGVVQIVFRNNAKVICTPTHKWFHYINFETKVITTEQLMRMENPSIITINSDFESEILEIKSITEFKNVRHVYDLQVDGNHNFLITEKNILTHNCDYLTPSAQAILRSVIETYASRCRFLLTCNYSDRIIPALRSRCQNIPIEPMKKSQVAKLMVKILDNEGVSYDMNDLKIIIEKTYPDVRSIINNCQLLVNNEKKLVLDKKTLVDIAECESFINILKSKKKPHEKTLELRTLLQDSKYTRDFIQLYKQLYADVEKITSDGEKICLVIEAVADFMWKDTMVTDHEINAVACLNKISQILE